MKKWFLSASLALLTLVAGTYILIPSPIRIYSASNVNCAPAAAQRMLTEKERWQRWWPGKETATGTFLFNGCSFRIDRMLFNGLSATVFKGEDSIRGELFLNAGDTGNVSMGWASEQNRSLNPVKRIWAAAKMNAIGKSIGLLLDSMKIRLEDPMVIYGFKPRMAKVTDEFMISVKETLNHYPTVSETYAVIGQIRGHISREGGTEKNPPMLNVTRIGDSLFQMMVAIPTTTELQGKGKFLLKKMVLGNILVGEITGGPQMILNSEKELEHFVRDHGKTSPAIPYQSLVTDRSLEQDTSKWITRLHYPVFF